ncbi:hypothetical protein DNTS_010166 [Danionella cerebrum]|uniref:Uncharacterized protein n=1 Tax=Danionella cerebrum TaxID=2873325 RepID=A0A553Q6M4_9TELE|nr:hypothetical protein DNTS_010166 [Danionella translucida]
MYTPVTFLTDSLANEDQNHIMLNSGSLKNTVHISAFTPDYKSLPQRISAIKLKGSDQWRVHSPSWCWYLIQEEDFVLRMLSAMPNEVNECSSERLELRSSHFRRGHSTSPPMGALDRSVSSKVVKTVS